LENLLQRSRYELKYIIQEPTAHEVRAFSRNHLMPDPYASPGNNYSFDIYSVYLDNPGRSLMNQTLEGLKNRFKLRVRFYDNNPNHPVFFEVKRRVNDVIVKVRAKVRRDAADRLMRPFGGWPDRSDLANPDDERSFTALTKFCQLRDKLECGPAVLVAYNREAWCSPEDDSVRVTFDRMLEAAPYHPDATFRLQRDDAWIRPIMRVPGIVLELKFTDRFPNWMRQMVQTYNLFRTSMAKYVTCQLGMAPHGAAIVRDVEAARVMLAAQRWEKARRRDPERDGAELPSPRPAPAQPAAPGPAAGLSAKPLAV
jgi:hypothetical protein